MKKFIFTVVILALSIMPIYSQVTLYSETVSGGQLDNPWYAGFVLDGVGNSLQPASFPGNPSGDGWVGMLSTDRPDSGGVGQTFSGDGSLTDFYMEANVFIPIGGTKIAEYYGIEFRIDSTGLTTAYQLVTNFRSMSPRMRFRKRTGGSPVAFRDWSAAEIPGGVPADSGWHKLAVKAVGNDFWLYFDDLELPGCPYQDTTSTPLLTQGFVGAYAFMLNFPYETTDLYVDDILVTDVQSAIEDPTQQVIESFTLEQNYPNPFNPSTEISFTVPSNEVVQISVYNSLGQVITHLVQRNFPAGNHKVSWNGRDNAGNEMPAGIYYYQMTAGDFQQTRKMLLVK